MLIDETIVVAGISPGVGGRATAVNVGVRKF